MRAPVTPMPLREPETAAEDLRNALQMLAPLSQDGADAVVMYAEAAARRVRTALAKIERETAVLSAARTVLDASSEDRLSLVDENRELRERYSDMEEIGYGHLFFHRPQQRFTIERRYRQVLGNYTDERLAMAHLKRLRAEDAARRQTTTTTEASAEGAGDENHG